MSTRSITTAQLLATAANILRGLGTGDQDSRQVAQSLVDAQQAGHDSHGVIRLVEYADFVKRGIVRPSAQPEVASLQGAAAAVTGNWGWGQLACQLAVGTADRLAREYGVAAVTVRHCNHIGRIGAYVEALASAGLVALACCNSDPAVAPYGGKARMLGTNPIAAALPLGPGEPPIVMDFATAATAEGKLRVARATGAPIDQGLVIDQAGRPASVAEAFYDGGALVPFGGHKGYALSVIIEMLAGALSGNHPSVVPEYRSGNGAVLIALAPGFFIGLDGFRRDLSSCAAALRNSPPVNPDEPVLLPGDVENQQRARRHDALQVPDEIWNQLVELAGRLGVVTDPAD